MFTGVSILREKRHLQEMLPADPSEPATLSLPPLALSAGTRLSTFQESLLVIAGTGEKPVVDFFQDGEQETNRFLQKHLVSEPEE